MGKENNSNFQDVEFNIFLISNILVYLSLKQYIVQDIINKFGYMFSYKDLLLVIDKGIETTCYMNMENGTKWFE